MNVLALSGALDAPILDNTRGELRQGDRAVRMTRTNRKLLMLLVANRASWTTYHQISEHLFGPEQAHHESLVRVHVYNLRRKLEGFSVELHTIRGKGYRLV